MSLSTIVKGTILGNVISRVAASEPRTTIAGATLSGLIAAQIDYNKLIQGDPQQIAAAIAAVIVAVFGWFTNHSKVVAPEAASKPSDPQK